MFSFILVLIEKRKGPLIHIKCWGDFFRSFHFYFYFYFFLKVKWKHLPLTMGTPIKYSLSSDNLLLILLIHFLFWMPTKLSLLPPVFPLYSTSLHSCYNISYFSLSNVTHIFKSLIKKKPELKYCTYLKALLDSSHSLYIFRETESL